MNAPVVRKKLRVSPNAAFVAHRNCVDCHELVGKDAGKRCQSRDFKSARTKDVPKGRVGLIKRSCIFCAEAARPKARLYGWPRREGWVAENRSGIPAVPQYTARGSRHIRRSARRHDLASRFFAQSHPEKCRPNCFCTELDACLRIARTRPSCSPEFGPGIPHGIPQLRRSLLGYTALGSHS